MFSPFKILIYILIITVLIGCTSTNNKDFKEFNFNLPSNNITEKIFREIKSISMRNNVEIIHSLDLNDEETTFIKGFLANYYLSNKYSRNTKKVFFTTATEKLKFCKNTNVNPTLIILNEKIYKKLQANCNLQKSNTYLVNLDEANISNSKGIKSVSIKDQLFFDNENILEIIRQNKFVYVSSKIEEIEKFQNFAKQNNFLINNNNLILLKENNDFEIFIAEVFGKQDSLRRNRNVEKILNQDLKFISRKRNDIEAIILSVSSESSKRLLPALKFNLLLNLKIFNMPNHYDSWNNTSSPADLNFSRGLEFPILVNKINFGDKEFSSLSSNQKVVYSLGFDMLGVVNDQNYFGFLGQYYLKNNKINLKPISLSFFEDKILQSF
jgi:hypothetical protein